MQPDILQWPIQGKIFYQRNGPVREDLVNRDGLNLVIVFAGSLMKGNPIEFASFGVHLGRAIVEYQVALEGGVMQVGTAGAKFR